MKYPVIYAAAAMTLLLVASCNRSKKPSVAPPVRVQTQAVEPSDISGANVYSGTVTEVDGVALSFTVPGTIARVNVAEGDRVAAGQSLASIDDSSLRNSHDITAAALAQAQDTYNRMRLLHDSGSISDMKWVEVENALSAARSADAISRKALDDATIHAPFSGYVSQKLADVGMTVAPGIPVMKVVKIDKVKVIVSVPETEIAAIGPSTVASVTVSALPGRTFTGRFAEKGVAANPITRTYEAKFIIDNPDFALLPGMIADVRLSSDAADAAQASAIVLPTSSVLLDSDNSNFVWLDSAGYAVRRTVEIGGMTDSGIIILSGVNPGDSVIIAGQQKVSTHTPVTSIN